jgi:DNA mismatch repair protein MutS2
MTGDEAVEAVERHLDRALLHNLPAIRIIHGKGTGALRERVQAAIAAHPQVSRHRLGELNEGGAGVTIVELG